jgi:FlaA1/EpsC-like NDP-sugar epimerase
MSKLTQTQRGAAIGDVAVLVVLTVVGFAAHETLDAVGRLLLTILCALVAWAAVAPFLGVYDERTIETPGELWRVGWAWLLAAPLATFLRGMALRRDIPWTFVLVTVLVNGFGLVAWRIALGWARARRARMRASHRV